jgi:hypothetical protein
MVTRIRNINPIQYAIVNAVLCALIGLILGVFFGLFSSAMGALAPGGGGMNFGWLSIIIFPIMYAVIGFIAGLIGAFVYNIVAGWTGGIEMTLSSAPVGAATATVP